MLSEETKEWTTLRDWEVVRHLNGVVQNVGAHRKSCMPPEDRVVVKTAVDAALAVIDREVSKLSISFRVPFVEAVAVLWPGAESPAQQGEQSGTGSEPMNDLLE